MSRQRIAAVQPMSMICHGQTIDNCVDVLLFLRRHEEHRGHRGGHLRAGRRLPPEPPPPGAPLREGARGSAATPTRCSFDGPTASVPLDTGFLVHNDRTYPNLVRLFARAGRRDARLGHVVRGVVPADRPRVQQPRRQRLLRAAAEPGQPVAPLAAARDRALQSGSAGAARGRRTRNARRSATSSSRAASARRSRIAICFRWRRRSGRRRSTRSDRFPRSRSSASSTTTGCSR